jgi:hypothetical protein
MCSSATHLELVAGLGRLLEQQEAVRQGHEHRYVVGVSVGKVQQLAHGCLNVTP